jgi:hypothetical protein
MMVNPERRMRWVFFILSESVTFNTFLAVALLRKFYAFRTSGFTELPPANIFLCCCSAAEMLSEQSNIAYLLMPMLTSICVYLVWTLRVLGCITVVAVTETLGKYTFRVLVLVLAVAMWRFKVKIFVRIASWLFILWFSVTPREMWENVLNKRFSKFVANVSSSEVQQLRCTNKFFSC